LLVIEAVLAREIDTVRSRAQQRLRQPRRLTIFKKIPWDPDRRRPAGRPEPSGASFAQDATPWLLRFGAHTVDPKSNNGTLANGRA